MEFRTSCCLPGARRIGVSPYRQGFLAALILCLYAGAAHAAVASFHGREYHQVRTATVIPYNRWALTGPHQRLPFGARVLANKERYGRLSPSRIDCLFRQPDQ